MHYDFITLSCAEPENAAITGYGLQHKLKEQHRMYSLEHKVWCIRSIPQLHREYAADTLAKHWIFDEKAIICGHPHEINQLTTLPQYQILSYEPLGNLKEEIQRIYKNIQKALCE